MFFQVVERHFEQQFRNAFVRKGICDDFDSGKVKDDDFVAVQ